MIQDAIKENERWSATWIRYQPQRPRSASSRWGSSFPDWATIPFHSCDSSTDSPKDEEARVGN